MKPLAERHEDRARRIVANASEVGGNSASSVGTSATLYRQFLESTVRLSESERGELDAQCRNITEEVMAGGFSLAEAPDGSGRTMAGIGVVNTKVVPAGTAIPEAGNGGGTGLKSVDGWGANEAPAAMVAGSNTNLGGQALQDQGAGSDLKAAEAGAAAGGGWGAGSGVDPLVGTVPDLEAAIAKITDAGEIDRLIAAEKAGKNRATAVEALEARKTAIEASAASAA